MWIDQQTINAHCKPRALQDPHVHSAGVPVPPGLGASSGFSSNHVYHSYTILLHVLDRRPLDRTVTVLLHGLRQNTELDTELDWIFRIYAYIHIVGVGICLPYLLEAGSPLAAGPGLDVLVSMPPPPSRD